ncbi:MAG TPA: chaperone modulator CbpM [Hyphomicrobiales bacterium]|nr:chaperone modulator CbpM [Hyphomicrobiales bacterium]
MTDLIVETSEDGLYTLVELREGCRLQESFIVSCVELGVVEVRGRAPTEWRFSNQSRLQLLRAWRLHHDLELQLAALPLVLELLDEIGTLRSETELLRLRLAHWER